MITAIIAAALLAAIAVLYILLVIGLPYGELAMGGRYTTVPKDKRYIYGISIVIQLAAGVIVLQTGGALPLVLPHNVTRIVCFCFAAYFTLNIILNAVSKSKKERAVMTPASAVIAVCFWITAALNG